MKKSIQDIKNMISAVQDNGDLIWEDLKPSYQRKKINEVFEYIEELEAQLGESQKDGITVSFMLSQRDEALANVSSGRLVRDGEWREYGECLVCNGENKHTKHCYVGTAMKIDAKKAILCINEFNEDR